MAPVSPLRLTAAESRYVLRGAAAVALVILGLAAFWLSPWSPEALDRPALLVAVGLPNLGLSAYDSLAHGPARSATRAEALWRGGNLAATDLDAPQRAVDLLRELTESYPSSPRVPDAWERLAAIYARSLQDPVRASEAWLAGAAAAPADPRVGDWQLEAGLALQRADQPARAAEALRAATAHPEVAVQAWLALGDVLLTDQASDARIAYQAALTAGAKGSDATLARLGMATALERLDRRDEALDELETAQAVGDGDDAIRLRIKLLSGALP